MRRTLAKGDRGERQMNYSDEKELRYALMEMLYCTVNGGSLSDNFHKGLTTEAIKAIYNLAQKHSLAHLVSRYLFENEVELDCDLAKSLQRASIKTIHRHELMKRSFREICSVFEEAGIDYVPLKGSVIRDFYPEEDMRTSCDVDILVREGDLDRAVEVLVARGYTGGERHYHDVSLYSPNGTHLELHFNVQEFMDNLDAVLKDAWDYAVPVGGHRYEFSKDFFVFHLYAHIAYHFLSGGCGIRSLMDIWIVEHKMNIDYTCALPLLKKAGIDTFAKEMSFISNRCFTERDYSDPILEYIWRGGVYGSRQNKLAVRKKKNGSSFAYIMRVIFLPYRDMATAYLFLKKYPVLLPFCWVHRWIRTLVRGRAGRLSEEIDSIKQVKTEDVTEVEEICKRLGL